MIRAADRVAALLERASEGSSLVRECFLLACIALLCGAVAARPLHGEPKHGDAKQGDAKQGDASRADAVVGGTNESGSSQAGAGQADPAARAEAAYRAGDYKAAQAAYRELLARAPDARVEYNLGNCAFRLSDYARALWRYERARRVLGDRKEIAFNRSLAIRRLGFIDASEVGLAEQGRRWIERWSALQWWGLGIVVELLGLGLLAWGIRRRGTGTMLVASSLVVLGLAAGSRALSVDDDRVLGVVVLKDGTALRSEPRAELAATLQLGAGAQLRYLASSPGWVRVRIGERDGWIPREAAGLW